MSRISDTKLRIFSRDLYRCQYKGCTVSGIGRIELAHRIKQGKGSIQYIIAWVYERHHRFISHGEAEEYLHNDLNLVTSCREHNDYFNCFFDPVATESLLKKIEKKLKNS